MGKEKTMEEIMDEMNGSNDTLAALICLTIMGVLTLIALVLDWVKPFA